MYDPLFYDPAIFEPLAQITVVDAQHGDANIIDLCQHSFDTDQDKWRRILIDTGPHDSSGLILSALLLALRNVPLPVPNRHPSHVPALDEFQVTHLDADHIGNASFLAEKLKNDLIQWRNTSSTYTCHFVFPHIPAPIPKLALAGSYKSAKYLDVVDKKGKNQECNQVVFALDDNIQWARDINLLDYEVEIELQMPYDKPLPEMDWTPIKDAAESFGTSNHIECTFTKAFRKHTVDIQCQIQIVDVHNRLDNVYVYRTSTKFSINLSSIPWVSKPRIQIPAILGFGTSSIGYSFLQSLVPSVDVIQFRTSEASIKGYVAKLGTSIAKLRKINGVSIATENVIAGKSREFDHPHGQGKIRVENYIGPSKEIFRDLGRSVLIRDYSKLNDTEYDAEMDDIATNRASIITIFNREDLGPKDIKGIKMLFTGDAYDRNCDVRKTVTSFSGGKPPIVAVGLLKVPHHGSNVTSDTSFYELVRAEVYLVCAAHRIHGNPKFSSLKAIVQGFNDLERTSGEPFRLFFSNPDSMVDYQDSHQSAVRKILQSEWAPRQVNGKWNYEMYRLKPSPKPKEYNKFGRILLGIRKDAQGNHVGMVEKPMTGDWQICHKWDLMTRRAVSD
ncbi:hypothetical protein MMC20_001833 [Loxospora ochrophaea]|nr:hypothetical protein [Loxospora ochrophaea]